MPEPLSPLGGEGGSKGGRAAAEVRQMALGSGSTPGGGGVWSSALHPHTLCACQQSPNPSVLGLDFRRPVRRLGQGVRSADPLLWDDAVGSLLGSMDLHP